MNIKCKIALMLLAVLTSLLVCPAYSQGLYGSVPCQARDALEAYCVSHGGCPRDGYCYFPDGSYCELRSFYNGSCPGLAYYEQAIWMNEAYNFLYGDWTYSYPYATYQSPPVYLYSSYSPYYLGPAFGPSYGYGYWI